MEMAARPGGEPAGREAAGRRAAIPIIPTFGFIEICESRKIESLVSTLLGRISLISMKPKGMVWKWQPAPAAGPLGGRPPAGRAAIPISPPSVLWKSANP